MSFVRIIKLKKTKKELVRDLGLSESFLYIALSRSELFKHKKGEAYNINIDFINNMCEYIKTKEITKAKIEKYKPVHKKLSQWRRYLTAQKVKA